MKRLLSRAMLPFVVVLVFTGCVRQTTVSRPAYFSVARTNLQAGVSPTEQKRIDQNCPFGEPALDRRWNFGPTDLIAREGYVLRHSATDKVPLWVCEHVCKDQLTGSEGRDDRFAPDPLLKPGRRAELRDYKRSGYDRGHLAPAADQTIDPQLKAETFYLSNMAPQAPPMNQQIWRELETLVRTWLIQRGEGYIITGPLFFDAKEEDGGTATGTVTHKVIGADAVAVPTHFYKIVAAKDAAGQWQTIAFVMENRKYKRPFQFADHVKSIDWIEERTGIDFMPELESLEERRLERAASPLWN